MLLIKRDHTRRRSSTITGRYVPQARSSLQSWGGGWVFVVVVVVNMQRGRRDGDGEDGGGGGGGG